MALWERRETHAAPKRGRTTDDRRSFVDANLVDPVDLRDYADLVSDFTRDEALDAPQPEFLNIELQNVDDAPVSRKEPRSKTAAHLT